MDGRMDFDSHFFHLNRMEKYLKKRTFATII